MSHWETVGQSDEWYTPKYIFDSLRCRFDLDPANAAENGAHVPSFERYASEGLEREWNGFVWLNPPFGKRNGLVPWIRKFINHGNGIILVPDRTSAPWFHLLASHSDMVLFVAGKIKFERPDGSCGKSPSTGTALFAIGPRGQSGLVNARKHGLGLIFTKSDWMIQ